VTIDAISCKMHATRLWDNSRHNAPCLCPLMTTRQSSSTPTAWFIREWRWRTSSVCFIRTRVFAILDGKQWARVSNGRHRHQWTCFIRAWYWWTPSLFHTETRLCDIGKGLEQPCTVDTDTSGPVSYGLGIGGCRLCSIRRRVFATLGRG
jgi:hypothetical protein